MTTHATQATQATEYLQRALMLLEQPRPPHHLHSWIRNAEAITKDNTYCEPQDERAVAWCTIGVVRAVTYYDPNPDKAYTYILSILNMANPAVLAQRNGANALPTINDASLSFDRVRRMFQKAIALSQRLA